MSSFPVGIKKKKKEITGQIFKGKVYFQAKILIISISSKVSL